jgi:anti-anti-sigma factor
MTLTELSPSEVAARVLRSGPLDPTVRVEGPRTVVALRGEADISTRPVLSDVLSLVIATRTGDVVIDLAELEFIDSATVRLLATAHQLLDRHDRKLTFRSPSRLAVRVLAVFELTRLIEPTADPR